MIKDNDKQLNEELEKIAEPEETELEEKAETEKDDNKKEEKPKRKLSKRVKAIIAAAASLLLVLILIIVVVSIPQKKDDKKPELPSGITSEDIPDEMGYIDVFSHEVDEVISVKVKRNNDLITLLRKNKKWQIKEASEFRLNSDLIEQVEESCKLFLARSVVSDDPKEFPKYDIGDKSTEVVLTFNTGDIYTVLVGKDSTSGGTYAFLKEKNKLYLMDSSWTAPFQRELSDFIDKTLIDGAKKDKDGNEEDPKVKKISYTGRGVKKPIIIELNPEYTVSQKEENLENNIAVDVSKYLFTSPIKAEISNNKFEGREYDYFNLKADSIHILRPAASDIKKCGLDKPFITVSVESVLKNFNIKLSEPFEKDGTYYHYAITSEKKPIFIVKFDDFSFYGEDLIEYVSPLVVNTVIDTIDTMIFETPDNKYEFNTYGKADDLKVRWDGKKLSTKEYRDLYQLVMLVYCEESVDGKEYNGKPDLKITYKYRDLEKIDVVEYIKVGPRKYMIRKNGNDLAFVRSRYVDTLLSGLDDFVNGRDVPSDY